MLDGEDGQHDRRTQQEGGVDAERRARSEMKPRSSRVHCHDVMAEPESKKIESRYPAPRPGADRQHRGPGEPVRPERQRRQDAAVADPGRGAMNGGAPALRGVQACDLCVGEGLSKSEQHRDRPDNPGGRPDGGRDGAHGEQNQSGNTRGDEDDMLPVDVAQHGRTRRSDNSHDSPFAAGHPLIRPHHARGATLGWRSI